MFLAAALDADVIDKDELEEVLTALGVGPVRIVARQVKRGGITGTHVHFEGWHEEEEQDHRHLSTVVDMLEASTVPAGVAERATSMFYRLGEVEAGIHGMPVEKVHFHECGALDSIFDFVSAAWIIERTNASWSVAPVSVGQGTMQAAHGTMPLPAPATVELLAGLELVPRDVEAELVTPTGATILRTLADLGRLTTRPRGRLVRTGYGAGTRDIPRLANLVRFVVLETAGSPEKQTTDWVRRLSCEIDDMSPELLAYIETQLMEAGALDVTREAVHMKKGRQGTRRTVLCRLSDQERLAEILFQETSTFGLRTETVQRMKLERRTVEVDTPYGSSHVKVGYLEGAPVKAYPEYDDCVRLAREKEMPLRTVYEVVQQQARRLLATDEPFQ